MQWLSLIFSFVLGRLNSSRPVGLKETALAVLDELAARSRKPVVLLLGGLACILTLCGGFFMSVIDLTSQFDREGSLRLTASFSSGVVLVAISLGVFFWIFNSAWPGARVKKVAAKEIPQSATASSFEQAVTLLVMDFVKEREYKREHRESHLKPHPEKESPPLYN